MSIEDNITIFCLVHCKAENAGLQRLENGANIPQDQSTERVTSGPNLVPGGVQYSPQAHIL